MKDPNLESIIHTLTGDTNKILEGQNPPSVIVFLNITAILTLKELAQRQKVKSVYIRVFHTFTYYYPFLKRINPDMTIYLFLGKTRRMLFNEFLVTKRKDRLWMR